MPSGLAARTFDVAGDDFVLFTWGDAKTEPEGIAGLSAAEREVLRLVVSGKSNRNIAQSREVSERTIANQVASILRKVGARSRFELIRRFSEA